MKIRIEIITALVLSAAVIGAISYFRPERGNFDSTVSSGDVLSSEDLILEDRTIVDFGENPDGTVAYSYLAALVPKKLDPKEVTEMRTETSYTKFVEVVEPGEDPIVKMETRIYPQPVFAQDVDGNWKYLEYATTTEQAFRERDASLWKRVAEVFVRTAYADTASPFTEAGDGQIAGSGSEFTLCSGTAWALARDDTSGSDNDTGTTMQVSSSVTEDAELVTCFATITRMFLPFDTSSISSSATISAASLNVFTPLLASNENSDNDGTDYVTVVRTSQATHTVLAATDVDNIGTTEGIDAGQRKDITSISLNAYLTFSLNSTGIGWIAKSGDASNCSATAGITCLGLREGHDFTGAEVVANTANSAQFNTSEASGTSNDPYLEVTYTAPVSSIPGPSFTIGANGLFEVGSSGLFEISAF